MSKFSISPTSGIQEARQRFAAPAAPSPTAPGAPPTGVRSDAPAPISAELAALLAPGMQRTSIRAMRSGRARGEGGARAEPRDPADASEAPEGGPEGATNFAYAGRRQSSSQHGDGGGHGGPSEQVRHFENEVPFQAGDDRDRVQRSRHMCRVAVDLPQRCVEHRLTHGSHAMPQFLRRAMAELLPGFMRDLAEKIDGWTADAPVMHSADAIKPVAEVCQDFLDLLRPLYLDHVSAHGPYLVTDAQEVLCTAQALLGDEMTRRSENNPRLGRILRRTVYPLWPILVMACMPRPSQSPDEGVHSLREASA